MYRFVRDCDWSSGQWFPFTLLLPNSNEAFQSPPMWIKEKHHSLIINISSCCSEWFLSFIAFTPMGNTENGRTMHNHLKLWNAQYYTDDFQRKKPNLLSTSRNITYGLSHSMNIGPLSTAEAGGKLKFCLNGKRNIVRKGIDIGNIRWQDKFMIPFCSLYWNLSKQSSTAILNSSSTWLSFNWAVFGLMAQGPGSARVLWIIRYYLYNKVLGPCWG